MTEPIATEEQKKAAYMADVKARFENLETAIKALEEFTKTLGHVPPKR